MASRALAQEGEELGLLARAQVFELKRGARAMAIHAACEDFGFEVPLGRVEALVPEPCEHFSA